MYDKNLYSKFDVKKMINLNLIKKIGFCSYEVDFLPGYNMYV